MNVTLLNWFTAGALALGAGLAVGPSPVAHAAEPEPEPSPGKVDKVDKKKPKPVVPEEPTLDGPTLEGPAKPEKPDTEPETKKAPPKKPAKVDPELAARRERAQGLVRRAQELAAMRRGDEALAALQQALEVYPAYPLAYHELGVTFAELGNLPQAEANLKKALELAPDFVRAEQALAEVMRRQKRYAEALGLFDKVLRAAPKDLASWYGVAASLRAQKKDGEALYALKQLIAAADNPEAPAVLEARKEVAVLEKAGVVATVWGGEKAPGERDEGPVTASAPGSLTRHAGDKAFAERRYLAALEAYKKAWSAKTPDAVLAYKIGATFAVMNDPRAALGWWRQALAADPGRELIARHLAILVGKLRDSGKSVGPAAPGEEDAVVRAKEALREGDPGTALFIIKGLDMAGAAAVEAEARLRLGDFERARTLFEELLGEDPDDRVAKGGLAEALLRMGQTGPAEKAIQAWVGVEGSEGGYKARPETFLVYRRGEVDARLLAPPEPEE